MQYGMNPAGIQVKGPKTGYHRIKSPNGVSIFVAINPEERAHSHNHAALYEIGAKGNLKIKCFPNDESAINEALKSLQVYRYADAVALASGDLELNDYCKKMGFSIVKEEKPKKVRIPKVGLDGPSAPVEEQISLESHSNDDADCVAQ